MSVDCADAVFATLQLNCQNAFPAKAIALPDFPYRRAGGERVKLRRRNRAPSCGSADEHKQSAPGNTAPTLDADRSPIRLQCQDETIDMRAEPDFLKQYNVWRKLAHFRAYPIHPAVRILG